jgi:tetratricopeptide (TPR) repeat protein
LRNIHPDVKYVGDAICAECHAEETTSFKRHPMGRSLLPIAQVAPAQVYTRAHNNPFESQGLSFQVDRGGDRVWHRQRRLDTKGDPVYELSLEVYYAIGSGTRGFSYLTNREGYLFQTPISWFSEKQVWDRSPGFVTMHATTRPVDGECLFCHANQAQFREDSRNRYDPPIFKGHAIGCERCHGPGEQHAQTLDPKAIVNPARLRPAERDAVCQQCHLEGEARVLRRGRRLYDFRPGLLLESFWTVFVAADRDAPGKSVNHVEQLAASRCYQGGTDNARIGCTTCHNPHEYVSGDQRVSYYRDRCLGCHNDHGCSLPESERPRKGDSCIDCHMPRGGTEDVPHTAATDHRILRRTEPTSVATVRSDSAHPRLEGYWAGLPAAPFHQGGLGPHDRRMARDFGIGLTMMAAQGKINAVLFSDRILAFLEDALHNDPDDVEARQARANLLAMLRRPDAALTEFEAVLAQRPERESALVWAGMLARALRHREQSLDYWRSAIAANPWMPDYHENLASLLAAEGAWEAAGRECQALLRLDPDNVTARQLWITTLLRQGKTVEARTEFEKVERLQPHDLKQLKAWFAEQLR